MKGPGKVPELTLHGKDWVRRGWGILANIVEDTLWTQEGPPVESVTWVLL